MDNIIHQAFGYIEITFQTLNIAVNDLHLHVHYGMHSKLFNIFMFYVWLSIIVRYTNKILEELSGFKVNLKWYQNMTQDEIIPR